MTRSTSRTMHRGREGALVAVVGLVLALAPGSGALADPTNPSPQDVQNAQKAVQSKSDEIAGLEVQLAQQSAVNDAAWQKVQIAGEAYTQATVDRDAAAQVAADTSTRYDAANQTMEKARKLLAGIAMQSARSGGSMDMAEAMLVSGGVQEVVDRTTALNRFGAKADSAAQSFAAAKLVADTLKQRAADALVTRDTKATEAQQALVAAQAAQTEAETAVAAAQAKREVLIGQLAVARQTSAAVEKARQDQIDADRVARADAAAQAARLAAPAAPSTPVTTPPKTVTPTPPAGTGSGSGTGTTNPPVVTPPTSSDPYGLGTGTSRGSAGQGQTAVGWANGQLGLPYGYGDAGPGSYDCSGLTMRAWQNAGVSLNRTSSGQYKQVLKISYSSLRVGDLVFWGSDPGNPGSVYHVAMWLGNNQILEAPHTGANVRVATMRWSESMPYAGRP